MGIDACANHSGKANSTINAGQAICLLPTTSGQSWQGEIHVPQGLQNVSLQVSLRHGIGNANLYHGFDYRPGRENFDFRGVNQNADETIHVLPVQAGWNYIDVAAEQSFSNVTLLARYIQHENDLPVPLVLPVNREQSLSIKKDKPQHFFVKIPSGMSNLVINAKGVTQDVDLYVNYAAVADKNQHQCQGTRTGNTLSCEIKQPGVGTYYLMVGSDQDVKDIQLKASVRSGDTVLLDACKTEQATDYSQLKNEDSTCIQYSDRENGRADFYFYVPQDSREVIVETGHGSGDINLYYRNNGWADQQSFDKATQGKGNKKQLRLTSPAPGWHYLRTHGQFKDTSIRMAISQ